MRRKSERLQLSRRRRSSRIVGRMLRQQAQHRGLRAWPWRPRRALLEDRTQRDLHVCNDAAWARFPEPHDRRVANERQDLLPLRRVDRRSRGRHCGRRDNGAASVDLQVGSFLLFAFSCIFSLISLFVYAYSSVSSILRSIYSVDELTVEIQSAPRQAHIEEATPRGDAQLTQSIIMPVAILLAHDPASTVADAKSALRHEPRVSVLLRKMHDAKSAKRVLPTTAPSSSPPTETQLVLGLDLGTTSIK